jgi:hypothetical protein
MSVRVDLLEGYDRLEEPTPANVWHSFAGRPITDDLLECPPDVLALTNVILTRGRGPSASPWPGRAAGLRPGTTIGLGRLRKRAGSGVRGSIAGAARFRTWCWRNGVSLGSEQTCRQSR